MFCTKCGKQIPDDSKFCEFCGERFEEPTGAPAATPSNPVNNIIKGVSNPMSEKKDSKQLIIMGVGAIVVLAVVICLLSLLFGNSPKSAVKQYIKDDIKYDNQGSIYETYWMTKKAQKKMGMEDVKYKLKDLKIKKVTKFDKDDDEFEFVQDYVDDNLDGDGDKIKGVAIVKVKGKILCYVDGDEDDEKEQKIDREYVVVKVGGKWYVTSISAKDVDNAGKKNSKDDD